MILQTQQAKSSGADDIPMNGTVQPVGIDPRASSDRGVAMISYALLVTLIAVVSIGALSMVGNNTSESFQQIPTALNGDNVSETTTTTSPGQTPKEKWDKAQEDWSTAIDEANATYTAVVAEANVTKSAQLDANKSLPKTERQAANQQANQAFNITKAAAKDAQNAAKAAANAANAAAQAEYKATK